MMKKLIAVILSIIAAPAWADVTISGPITFDPTFSNVGSRVTVKTMTPTAGGLVPTPPNDATKVLLGNGIWGTAGGGFDGWTLGGGATTASVPAVINVPGTLGSELLSNPTFMSNDTGWTLGAADGDTVWTPGLFTTTCTICSDESVSINFTTVAGHVYQITSTFTITGDENDIYTSNESFDAHSAGPNQTVFFRATTTGTDTVHFDFFNYNSGAVRLMTGASVKDVTTGNAAPLTINSYTGNMLFTVDPLSATFTFGGSYNGVSGSVQSSPPTAFLVSPAATAGSNNQGSGLNILGGDGDGTGAGGNLFLSGGQGIAGDGGAVTISAGNSQSGTGASAALQAGNSGGAHKGGTSYVSAGNGGSTGDGGDIFVAAGVSGSTSGNAGKVAIDGGTSTNGTGGDVALVPGSSGLGLSSGGNLLIKNLKTSDPSVTDAFWVSNGVLIQSGHTLPLSTTVNGQICTLGSTCTITASAGTVTVGTTTIASGTDGRILSQSGTLLAEIATTGTGNVVLASALPSLPLALASGGTHTDLSGTGGTSQVLKQISSGADITVARLACADLSDSAGGCSTAGGTTVLNTSALIETLPNAGTGGTTANKLAIYTTGATVKTAAVTDTSTVIGICVPGITGTSCGTTGNASVAIAGQASCVFDGATTAGDFVVTSTSVAGDCHDAGATVPVTVAVLGQVLSTNGGGGTYAVDISPIGSMAALNSKAQPGGSNTQVQFNSSGGFLGDANMTKVAGALTLGVSGTLGSVTMGNATTGTVTVQPVTGALGTVTASLPANTGTIAETNLAQTWSAAQTFGEVHGTVATESTTSRTVSAADCGKTIIFTNAAANTYTTLNSISPGCSIAVEQGTGAGQVTITNGSGATHTSAHGYTKTFAAQAILGIFVDVNPGGSAANYNITGDGA